MANLLKIVRSIADAPLNRGYRLRALAKFARWQLTTRIQREARAIRWIDDAQLLVRRGQTTLTGNLYSGLLEYEDMAFAMHTLREEDLFVDVGANMGVFTIIAGKVVGANVVCYEPVPSTFAWLRKQLLQNKIENRVRANNKGVGKESGVLRFTGGKGAMNRVVAGSIQADGQVSEVEVTTLDEDVETDRPIMLKIDVEGFELFVLEGAKNLLASGSVYAIIIELNGSGSAYRIKDGQVHDLLLSYGYAPVTYHPRNRNLLRLGSFNPAGNTLYVKDLPMMQARCKKAASRTVHTAFSQEV